MWIIKNLLLTVAAGVVAAFALTWYLNQEDPFQLQTRDVRAIDVAVDIPERETWPQRALDVVGAERAQTWLSYWFQYLAQETAPPLAGEEPEPSAAVRN